MDRDLAVCQRGSIRLGTVIVLGIALGVAVALLYPTLQRALRERAEASLAEPRAWPPSVAPGVCGATFTLQTSWREGHVHFWLQSTGNALGCFGTVWDRSIARLTITFSDKNGFKMAERAVKLLEIITLYDNQNRESGLEWKGDEAMTSKVYRACASWTLIWHGFPELPANAEPGFILAPDVSAPAPRPWDELEIEQARESLTSARMLFASVEGCNRAKRAREVKQELEVLRGSLKAMEDSLADVEARYAKGDPGAGPAAKQIRAMLGPIQEDLDGIRTKFKCK